MRYLLFLVLLGFNYVKALEIPDKGICVVEYFEEHCTPCTPVSKELDKMKDIKVFKEVRPPEIKTVPLVIIYKDGKVFKFFEGFKTVREIRELIEHD